MRKIRNALEEKLWKYLNRNYMQVYTLKQKKNQIELCKVLGTYQRDDDAFRAIANVASGVKSERQLLAEHTERRSRKITFEVYRGESE